MTIFSRIIWLLILTVFIALLYSHFTREPIVETPEQIQTAVIDPRLSACQSLTNAAPSNELDNCRALATEGSSIAQKRLAWAYSQQGEHQDWQAAYDWLQGVAQQNRNIELLRHIILFVLGTTEEDKRRAEEGIKALANIQQPGAQAYLAALYHLQLNLLPREVNTGWLLENAYASQRAFVNVFDMVSIYVNGFGTRANLDKATKTLTEYAHSNFPVTANNAAWFLSTLEQNPLTERDYPLQLVKSVVDVPAHSGRYTYVDTMAAAYAAAGQFEQAIQTQQQAIELLKAEMITRPDLSHDLADFEQRLAIYQQQKPLVLESLNISEQDFFAKLKDKIEKILLNSIYEKIEVSANSTNNSGSAVVNSE